MRSSTRVLVVIVALAATVGCDPESWFSSEVTGETPPVSAEPDRPEGPENTVEPLIEEPAAGKDGEYPLMPTEDGGWAYDEPDAKFTANIAVDGSVQFVDRQPPVGQPFDAGVRFTGPADWEAKARGKVAHGPEKLAFLRWTEDHRTELSKEAAAKRIDDAQRRLRNELDLLWNDTEKPSAEKRRLLFERWDECLEAPEGDDGPLDARTAAGERARLYIDIFIRERLPEGSEDGYGKTELAKLNEGRKSKRTFDPYRPASL